MDRSRLTSFLSQPLADLTLAEAPVVSTDDPVSHAVAVMGAGSRSCVLALDGGRLAGIFTERDVLTRCMGEGFDWAQPLGRSVLTPNPRTIGSRSTVAEAIATMRKHRYRTLPVVNGEAILGLVRLGDLLTHLAEVYPEEILNLPPRPHQVMEKQEGG